MRYRNRLGWQPLEDLVEHFFNSEFWGVNSEAIAQPLQDFKIEYALPGIKKECIKITHDGLNLKIEVDSERLKKNITHRLPANKYNIEKMEVKYADGLLELAMPLKKLEEESKVKEIEIK